MSPSTEPQGIETDTATYSGLEGTTELSGSMLLETAVVHQPTRTMANKHECFRRQICGFAGVFEQQRTTTTLWL
jgi:hypothetical protein